MRTTKKMLTAILFLTIFCAGFGSVKLSFGNPYVSAEELEESTGENSNLEPVYRLYDPNLQEHFYTKSDNEKNKLVNLGLIFEGIVWYSPKVPNSLSKPIFRLYNINTGRHLFTPSENEKNKLINSGWTYEKIAFYTYEGLPMNRFYNPNNGDHLYTLDGYESNKLIAAGWIREKIIIEVAIVQTDNE